MNLSIKRYQTKNSASKIQVMNAAGDTTEFLTADFFDWYCTWHNEQGHGTFFFDAIRGIIFHTSTETLWDEEREESYEVPNRGTALSYMEFFAINQMLDLFTRFTQSKEDLAWVGRPVAA